MEFVPDSGSAVQGSNACCGVISVATKSDVGFPETCTIRSVKTPPRSAAMNTIMNVIPQDGTNYRLQFADRFHCMTMILSNAIYRSVGNLLSPQGSRARLSILIYHRILAEEDPLLPGEPSIARFDRQMEFLTQVFRVLPLAEAVQRLRTDSLPARAASITFDDGYADNSLHALPILRKYRVSATFFIATAYLDGGRMFNDTVIESIRRAESEHIDLTPLGLGEHDLSTPEAKACAIARILPRVKYLSLEKREETVAKLAERITRAELPRDLMLTTSQLLELQEAGMDIGGHTHRHPILAGLDATTVRAEIAEGKDWLEGILGRKVRMFAYPNGKVGVDYRPEQAALVREVGYEAAVSTHIGVATAQCDPYQLPRFTPWSPRAARFVPAMLHNLLRVADQATLTPTPPTPAGAPETP